MTTMAERPPVRAVSVRTAAVEKAAWLYNHNAVVIDTETTGIAAGHEVCEISAVGADGEVLLDTLVQPVWGVTWGASQVHGITAEHLVNAPVYSVVQERLIEICHGRPIVAYNLAFDRRMLMQSAQTTGCVDRFERLRSVVRGSGCLMLLYADYCGERNERYGNNRWRTLAEAADEHGIAFEGRPHRALTDTKVAARLLGALASMTR